jgi:asparagine synthase (glutamine-hydrolysing)
MWLNPDLWHNGIGPARLFDPTTLRKLLCVPLEKELYLAPQLYRASLGSNGGQTLLQKATSADYLSFLPEDILVKVDRASMLASLEVRAPMLDYRLIEFAFREVPDSLKCTSHGGKILLKRLACKWLPREFDQKRKQGFSIPLRDWMNGPWRNTIQEILAEAPNELFNKKELLRLPKLLRFFNLAEKIYSICLFELWRRHYHISL